MPAITEEIIANLKQLYESEGQQSVQYIVDEIAAHMAPKCARCGEPIFHQGILWHVKTDGFEGIACQKCQSEILGPPMVTYFDRAGNR